MIVLDTNVLSELIRPEVSEPAVEWVNRQPAAMLWTTTICLMEFVSASILCRQGGEGAGWLGDSMNYLEGCYEIACYISMSKRRSRL